MAVPGLGSCGAAPRLIARGTPMLDNFSRRMCPRLLNRVARNRQPAVRENRAEEKLVPQVRVPVLDANLGSVTGSRPVVVGSHHAADFVAFTNPSNPVVS